MELQRLFWTVLLGLACSLAATLFAVRSGHGVRGTGVGTAVVRQGPRHVR